MKNWVLAAGEELWGKDWLNDAERVIRRDFETYSADEQAEIRTNDRLARNPAKRSVLRRRAVVKDGKQMARWQLHAYVLARRGGVLKTT